MGGGGGGQGGANGGGGSRRGLGGGGAGVVGVLGPAECPPPGTKDNQIFPIVNFVFPTMVPLLWRGVGVPGGVTLGGGTAERGGGG